MLGPLIANFGFGANGGSTYSILVFWGPNSSPGSELGSSQVAFGTWTWDTANWDPANWDPANWDLANWDPANWDLAI